MYQRRRTACCMNGGGPGSGVWKSTDGGDTWTKLTEGLPNEPMGRIGLDVNRRRPNVLYATVEGQSPLPAARGGAAAPTPDEAPQGGGRGATTAVGVDKTPTGLYRSDDAGATWRKVNNENARPMYFSQVRIDPNDPETVFYAGVKLHKTDRRRQDRHAQRDADDPRRRARDLDRSGQLEPRHHRQRRRRRDQLGHDENVELRPQHPGRPLLSRQLRHGDAVQHLRRHAGQLQLVRPERGARRGRHRRLQLGDDAGRRRLRRLAGSDRLPHRVQRVAGRQHGPHRSRHRRDDFDPSAAQRGGAGAAMELGHAAHPVAERSEGPLRGGQQSVPLGQPWIELGDGRQRSHRQRRTASRSSRWA